MTPDSYIIVLMNQEEYHMHFPGGYISYCLEHICIHANKFLNNIITIKC